MAHRAYVVYHAIYRYKSMIQKESVFIEKYVVEHEFFKPMQHIKST